MDFDKLMQSCADACVACLAAMTACLSACLAGQPIADMTALATAARDEADRCTTACRELIDAANEAAGPPEMGAAMRDRRDRLAQLCGQCADICGRCAAACRRSGYDAADTAIKTALGQCAAVADSCAATCGQCRDAYARLMGVSDATNAAMLMSGTGARASAGSAGGAGSRAWIITASTGPARETPMALTGLPREINGQPVRYFRKEVVRVGEYVHPASGQRFTIDRARMDKWAANFARMRRAGIRPFVPQRHPTAGRPITAAENYGYVEDLSREGDSLYAVLQLIGEDACRAAARNDVSVGVAGNARDSNGTIYDEAVDHIALCPDPVITGLSGFTALAASSGAAPEAVIFQRGAASQNRSPHMDLLTKLRELFGAADLTEDQAMAKVTETRQHLDSANRDLQLARTAQQAAEDRVLDLSRGLDAARAAVPSVPDDNTLMLLARSLQSERDAAITAGWPPAALDEMLKLFNTGGKLNALALSRSAGSADPLVFRLFSILRNFKPLPATGERSGAQVMALARAVPDGAANDGGLTDHRRRELLALTAAGQAVLDDERSRRGARN